MSRDETTHGGVIPDGMSDYDMQPPLQFSSFTFWSIRCAHIRKLITESLCTLVYRFRLSSPLATFRASSLILLFLSFAFSMFDSSVLTRRFIFSFFVSLSLCLFSFYFPTIVIIELLSCYRISLVVSRFAWQMEIHLAVNIIKVITYENTQLETFYLRFVSPFYWLNLQYFHCWNALIRNYGAIANESNICIVVCAVFSARIKF